MRSPVAVNFTGPLTVTVTYNSNPSGALGDYEILIQGRQITGTDAAGNGYTASLEYRPILDQPGDSAATLGAGPLIAAKRLSLDCLERGDDTGLQTGKIIARSLNVHGCVFGSIGPEDRVPSARWPMSWRYCMPGKRISPTAAYAAR